MFGFFRRKQNDAEPIDGATWGNIDQDHEQLLVDITHHLDARLSRMRVDVTHRRFVPRQGKPMGITELACSVHVDKPGMPVEVVEECLIDWLEQSYWPKGMSEEKMERQQVKIDAWIEAHWQAREPVG